jgi:hypothetical protein
VFETPTPELSPLKRAVQTAIREFLEDSPDASQWRDYDRELTHRALGSSIDWTATTESVTLKDAEMQADYSIKVEFEVDSWFFEMEMPGNEVLTYLLRDALGIEVD